MRSNEDEPGQSAREPRSRRSEPIRRALLIAVVVLAASIPAVVAYGGCAKGRCPSNGAAATQVPFCSLPPGVRTRIAAGYQFERSPELLAVTAGTPVMGSTAPAEGDLAVPWLSVDGPARARVPLVFLGPGVRPGSLPRGTTLDDVEPTLVRILGIRTRQRERTGSDLGSVELAAPPPRLVVLVAWEGIGSADLGADRSSWPVLDGALRAGVGTLSADTGSLPLDPAAVLATIGTGSTPSEHGITGTWLRTPYGGDVVRAGGTDGPPAVLPTIAQELVHAHRRTSHVALVEPTSSDQGLVGTEYFIGDPLPRIRVASPGGEANAARELLAGGLGAHRTPDMLAVVLRGPVGDLDRETQDVIAAAASASGGRYLAVLAGTGSATATPGSITAGRAMESLFHRLPGAAGIIKAVSPGGIFLRKHAKGGDVGSSDVVDTLAGLRGPSRARLMADAFDSFAVSLGKYCSQ